MLYAVTSAFLGLCYSKQDRCTCHLEIAEKLDLQRIDTLEIISESNKSTEITQKFTRVLCITTQLCVVVQTKIMVVDTIPFSRRRTVGYVRSPNYVVIQILKLKQSNVSTV